MTWKTQLRSDAGLLKAVIVGQGPTVVLIHGVGLRAEAWGAQINALSQSYRVVAVDMPGHGESGGLSAGADLADFTDAIVPALDGSAVIIGHSYGAMIALDMAVRYPQRVKGVAALNAIYMRDAAAQSAVQARAASLDGKTMVDPTSTLQRWFGSGPSSERDACEAWLRSVDPACYRAAYNVFAAHNGPSPSELAAIECPALFLTGADEPNSTPAMSHQMAALVPNGRFKILDDAAHMLPMTHGSQVNATLMDFVRGCA